MADDPDIAPGGGQDFVTRATETLSTISAFWILLLAAIFLYDIIGRELFDTPFLGTHEIVGNSIVGILFLELPSTIKRGAMLRTTIVYYAVSTIPRRVIDCASYLLGVGLFLAIIFGGWDAMIVSWEVQEIEGAGAFEVPIYPVRTLIILFSSDLRADLSAAVLRHRRREGGGGTRLGARSGGDSPWNPMSSSSSSWSR